MATYWADIQYLRKAGCSLEQVRQFLAENNVSVTVAGLSQYIRRREQKESQEQNKSGIETRVIKPEGFNANERGQGEEIAAEENEQDSF